jgi:putative ATPase
MKTIGYGSGYAYYFDDPDGSFNQSYLPEALEARRFFKATGEGWEDRVRSRLEALLSRHKNGTTP